MKRIWIFLFVILIGTLAGLLWLPKKKPQQETAVPVIPHREKPLPPVPALLPARQGTPENPIQSWERLLASDGSPSEDHAALADTVTNFLESTTNNPRPALGTNDEITHALTNYDLMGDAAIPKIHPAIINGQLVDRWGSPWFFHQLSANVIEVRSAGPDHKLFTSDDVK